MKTRPCLTERLLTGRKESNKKKNRLSSRCSPMQEMSKVCVLAHYPRRETAKQQRLRPNCAQIKHLFFLDLDFLQAFLKITRRIIFKVLPFFHELTCPSVLFAMGIVRFIWLRFLVLFSRALSYDVGVYSFRSPMISFGDITGQSLQRLCRDCTKTAQA